jgi:hypothetical protein
MRIDSLFLFLFFFEAIGTRSRNVNSKAMTGHTNRNRTLFLLGCNVECNSKVNKSGIRTTTTRHEACICLKKNRMVGSALTLVDISHRCFTVCDRITFSFVSYAIDRDKAYKEISLSKIHCQVLADYCWFHFIFYYYYVIFRVYQRIVCYKLWFVQPYGKENRLSCLLWTPGARVRYKTIGSEIVWAERLRVGMVVFSFSLYIVKNPKGLIAHSYTSCPYYFKDGFPIVCTSACGLLIYQRSNTINMYIYIYMWTDRRRKTEVDHRSYGIDNHWGVKRETYIPDARRSVNARQGRMRCMGRVL